MNRLSIVVTGSNGLLGQKLTDIILRQDDINLTAISRGANRHPVQKGYTYVDLDLTDGETLRDTIRSIRPDCIIHTAALTHVDVCEEDPERCRQLNVTLVEDLIHLCEEYDIHLVHLSTDFIFDGLDGPYREEDPAHPLSVYGQSKWESEQLVRHSSCTWTIIRTILVYGILNDMSRSNIVLWAKAALEKGQEIRVVRDQWRMPTLAEDLAAACLAAAKGKVRGVFHVSGSELMAITEIVQEIAAFWNLDPHLIQPIDSETLNQKARRPRRTGFILEKAVELLGYQPHTFREGLALVDEQLRQVKESQR